MKERQLLLTSSGLSETTGKIFFKAAQKGPEEMKILYVPTVGIETDGAREGFAICLHEMLRMGIRQENVFIYNLELLLSKGYKRTYSAYVETPSMAARLLTQEEMQAFDAVFVSGGDCAVLCREMVRTGFNKVLLTAVNSGLFYVGISAGSMYAAGNLEDSLHVIENPIISHWEKEPLAEMPEGSEAVCLADGQAVYVTGDKVILIC